MDSVEKTLNHSHLKDRDRGHDSTGAWTRFSSGESRDQKTVNVQKKKQFNKEKHNQTHMLKFNQRLKFYHLMVHDHC